MKILWLDDNASILELGIDWCTRPGRQFLPAQTVDEAVSLLEMHFDISLIISDFFLANGHSGPLFTWLKTQGRLLPVILFSSYTEPELKQIICYDQVIGVIDKFQLKTLATYLNSFEEA